MSILALEDVEDFRAIRLSALLKSPQSFAALYAQERIKPIAVFQDCLKHSTVFAAYHEKNIIAVAILSQDQSPKCSHKAYLNSVFVEPEYQAKGIGTLLLNYVIDYAKTHTEQILLTVLSDNLAAVRLYNQSGFEIYGKEPKALKFAGQYSDEYLMKLILH